MLLREVPRTNIGADPASRMRTVSMLGHLGGRPSDGNQTRVASGVSIRRRDGVRKHMDVVVAIVTAIGITTIMIMMNIDMVVEASMLR